jgi:hypothetical protein
MAWGKDYWWSLQGSDLFQLSTNHSKNCSKNLSWISQCQPIFGQFLRMVGKCSTVSLEKYWLGEWVGNEKHRQTKCHVKCVSIMAHLSLVASVVASIMVERGGDPPGWCHSWWSISLKWAGLPHHSSCMKPSWKPEVYHHHDDITMASTHCRNSKNEGSWPIKSQCVSGRCPKIRLI